MAIGRQQRRAERRAAVAAVFPAADAAERALDLLELVELAWHDAYGEVTPPDDVVADLLTVSAGTLAGLLDAARVALLDRRDLRVAAGRRAVSAPAGEGRARPVAVLAMSSQLAGAAFTPAQRERLARVVELRQAEPLTTFEGADLADVEVILGHWGCPPIDGGVLDRAPALRLVAYAAGSVKERGTITPEVLDRGVLVTSAAAANAVPVAEYTLAAILLANKGVFLAREWLRAPDEVRARRPRPVGNLGKTVGIVGASLVGRRVIERLRPFDLDVVVTDPYLSPEDATELGVRAVTLDELLETADVVSLHAPLLPSTTGMIGRAELACMKDGAVLVNTARGAIVVTADLEAELETGRISAVLDVTDPEPLDAGSALFRLPNVFVTPHVAGAQGSELERLADLALTEIERYVIGLPPLHPVRAEVLDRLA